MTYIAPHSKPLLHLDRLHAWKHGEKAAPVTVEWDLSNVCSLKCTGCHFAHTHERGPWAGAPKPDGYTSSGILADPDLVRRGLREMWAEGVRSVVWSGGGEPTLHPDFIDIIQHAERIGLQQGLYTLGGHLDAERARIVGQVMQWVVVSLDAHTADRYATEKGVTPERFTAACDGVGMIAKRSATVGVSFLLHRGNWIYMYDMLKLARSLGATYTTFRPLIETDPHTLSKVQANRSWIREAEMTLRATEQEPDVEMSTARFLAYAQWQGHGYKTCYGIRLHATVTPDGRVWVCPNRRGIEGSSLGDLTTQSFADIWSAHPGQWKDFTQCRAMCRLHPVNQTLAQVYTLTPHSAFI